MKITITNPKNLEVKILPLRWEYDYTDALTIFTEVSKVHYGTYEITVTRGGNTQLKSYTGEITNHKDYIVATVAANKLHKNYMENLIRRK